MNVKSWRVSLAVGMGVLVLLGLVGGASSEAANVTTYNQVQWKAEIRLSFTPEQIAQPGWQTKAATISSDLASRTGAQGVDFVSKRETQNDGGLDYVFTLSGNRDLAQFKQAIFEDAEPIGGLVGSPATITLSGDVAQNETLSFAVESNPSTGYAWEIKQWDAKVLRRTGETEFTSDKLILGAPEKQTVQVQAVGAGRTTLVLAYHRPWQSEEQPTRRITLEAARLSMLTDLGSPSAPQSISAAELTGHHSPSTLETAAALPGYFSWKDQGKLTPIRDQKSCGGCWAFSTVGAFEPALLIKSNLTTNLSEQYLISCNQDGWGCSGGWFAHDYHVSKLGRNQTQAGAVLEADFPYTATDSTCSKAYSHPYQLNQWYYVGNGSSVPSVAAIKDAIYNHGPVSAAICVGSAFQGYQGGVFATNESCGSGVVNHAIVLAGWNDTNQTWLLRNSWGAWWGEQGYMRIKWGTSMVGFAANYVDYQGSFTPQNLLRNPSFELDSNKDGKPDGWGSSPYWTRSSASVQQGSYAGRLYATNNAAPKIKQAVKVGAGKTYNFSGWVNIPATNDTFTLTLDVRWLKASGSLIRTDTVATYTQATAGWTQPSAALIAPAGSASAVVRAVATNLNATIYLDNFSFSQ